MRKAYRIFFTVSLLSFITMFGSCVGCIAKVSTAKKISYGQLNHQDKATSDRLLIITIVAFHLGIATLVIGGFCAKSANKK